MIELNKVRGSHMSEFLQRAIALYPEISSLHFGFGQGHGSDGVFALPSIRHERETW
jgi:hypothetical protein